MNRRHFIYSGAAFAFAGSALAVGRTAENRYDNLQAEIDQVRRADYLSYMSGFKTEMLGRFAALQRMEDAFDRVLKEVRETKVTGRPSVWFLYNMGIVVKTPETCFAVDLMHRRGEEFAPLLDFALITHNHGDHYTESFYAAMNGAGKTVVSNFKDNYGTKDWRRDGGYMRADKTFGIRDVEVTTGLTDHNDYLVDFTSTFEIKSHGFVIYHMGDCSSLAKLNPSATPDLWCVHPRCGLKPAAAVKKFSPKLTAVLHLNEMAHDVNRWRWTWWNGLSEKTSVEAVGGRAVVPVWGERIV